MNENKLVRFDWAMKHLLRNKANYDIVEGFLCALLDDNNIKVIEILEGESNQEDKNNKFNRVDVLVKDALDRNVIIEIQNTRESDYLYRILYGTSKNITESIEIGDKYRNINKVISISILYFNLGIGEDYIYHGTTDFVGLTTSEHITKDSEKVQNLIPKGAKYNSIEIFPEYYLIQVEKYQNIVTRAIDEWIFWFKNEQLMEGSHSKHINKVEEKLKVLKMSKKERKAYEDYLGRLASERDMIETAEETGRKKAEKEFVPKLNEAKEKEKEAREKEKEALEKEKMAREKEKEAREKEKETKIKLAQKMKKYGESIEEILKETGLSIDEINAI